MAPLCRASSSHPIHCPSDADFASLLRTAIEKEANFTENSVASANTLLQSPHPVPPQTAAKSTTQAGTRQHKKRKRVRDETILADGYGLTAANAQKHVKRSHALNTDLKTEDLPVASGACTALNKPRPQKTHEVPEIENLIQQGFQYVACGENGVPSNIERPILDSKGRIIALVAACPRDNTFNADAKDLFDIIVEESDSNTFKQKELNHKRGDFPAINFGFTLPNGFKDPINLENTHHEEKICRITGSPGFIRISAFQNASFAFWNPGVYQYQRSRIERLLAEKPELGLKRTTPKTIFPTTACNFRNVCCIKHRDTQNCPFGWCSITALGEFDHTRGGHLVLWELKLIIEFPHGYTIFIPSATITHSNIPVVKGDRRVSITQYCAGSIFRYVDNGFRTDKAFKAQDRLHYDEMCARKPDMWKVSLGLLTKLEDLKKRVI